MKGRRIYSFLLAIAILLTGLPSVALAQGALTATVTSITAASEMNQGSDQDI